MNAQVNTLYTLLGEGGKLGKCQEKIVQDG